MPRQVWGWAEAQAALKDSPGHDRSDTDLGGYARSGLCPDCDRLHNCVRDQADYQFRARRICHAGRRARRVSVPDNRPADADRDPVDARLRRARGCSALSRNSRSAVRRPIVPDHDHARACDCDQGVSASHHWQGNTIPVTAVRRYPLVCIRALPQSTGAMDCLRAG